MLGPHPSAEPLPFEINLDLNGVMHSKKLDAFLQRNLFGLDEILNTRSLSCSVFIDRAHHTPDQHSLFSVHFELATPEYSLVVNRVCNEDLYVAMRGAIDALKNQAKEKALRKKSF
jgi:hypothetical protein